MLEQLSLTRTGGTQTRAAGDELHTFLLRNKTHVPLRWPVRARGERNEKNNKQAGEGAAVEAVPEAAAPAAEAAAPAAEAAAPPAAEAAAPAVEAPRAPAAAVVAPAVETAAPAVETAVQPAATLAPAAEAAAAPAETAVPMAAAPAETAAETADATEAGTPRNGPSIFGWDGLQAPFGLALPFCGVSWG